MNSKAIQFTHSIY